MTNTPVGYDLKAFIRGYNRRNTRKFECLSFAEIRALANKYAEIDPMISGIIQAAYAKHATA